MKTTAFVVDMMNGGVHLTTVGLREDTLIHYLAALGSDHRCITPCM